MEHEASETHPRGAFSALRVAPGLKRAASRVPAGMRGRRARFNPPLSRSLPPRTHKAGNMATSTLTSSSQLAAARRLADGGERRRARLGAQSGRPPPTFPGAGLGGTGTSPRPAGNIPSARHGDAAEVERLLNCRCRPVQSLSLKCPELRARGCKIRIGEKNSTHLQTGPLCTRM